MSEQTKDDGPGKMRMVRVSPASRRDAHSLPEPKSPGESAEEFAKLEEEKLRLGGEIRELHTALMSLSALSNRGHEVSEKRDGIMRQIRGKEDRMLAVKQKLLRGASRHDRLADEMRKNNKLLQQILDLLREKLP